EPFSDRNLRAFGYDMFSEPVRRTAMELARDTDSATLSGKVVLIQETDEKVQAGTLIYVPVYRKGMPTGTVEQRRAAIYGWVYSPYRMNDLLKGVLGGGNLKKAQRLHLEIFDGTQTSPQSLLYESHPSESECHRNGVRFTRQIPLVFNGHSWLLRFTEIGGGLFTAEYTKVWFILGGGVLVTLLLFTLILVLLNTRATAQLMAEALTVDLREERQRMANIIQGTNVGTWEWNVQTGEAILNDIWAEIIGYTLSELAPTSIRKWEELVHPDDIKHSRELLKRHFSGEIPFYDCEYRMKHKDGHWVWVQDCGQLITRTDAGKPLMMFGTHADITARKLVEETFARMSREWQRTFDSMSEAVWILDKNHLLLRSNKAAERYFHRPCAEMMGRHCWEIVHGTTQAIPECPTMRVRKSLHHESQEIQIGKGDAAV
ncbi:MAG: CHASE domain-containing protein, partial [Verrucomicrobiota bacterium]